MILMVSGRTDVVAFYSKWFIKRYHAGFIDTRNPFNPHLISRIDFNNVDLIMFCTKNPHPIIPYLKEITKPILFHVTLTSYDKDIEPNVPDKKKIIEDIKRISNLIGIDNIHVRYDPILLNHKYTVDYHIKAFNRLCNLLDGYVKNIIISFVDDYKNVRKNMSSLQLIPFTDEDYQKIGESFSKSAKEHNMTVRTCFEEHDLTEYGFLKDDCLSATFAYKLTGNIYPIQTARKGKKCHCVRMVDIGEYNSCNHRCKYCYANYSEKDIEKSIANHNPHSTLLIGEIGPDDIIKERYK